MTPIEFKEQNVVFAKDQPPYLPLPAMVDVNSDQGEVVTCWGLSLSERLRVLFKGNIWMTMMTFHKPVTPVYMSTKKSDVIL
jgi:hypothetical protein